MLAIGRIGGVDYYTKLEAEDYYTYGKENQGDWQGQGASALGLSGPVPSETLVRLFEGFSPDGRQALVMNAGSQKRRFGWDLTLSASKSFSTLWSQAEPALRTQLENVFDAAVTETIRYSEDNAAFVRVGKGGAQVHKAGLVVAVFKHYSSRNLDPNVHAHCLVVNLGVTEEKTNSLLSPVLYDHKMDIGAIFRAELAARLERDLGLEVERRNEFFEIKGVPHELMKAFSSRRVTIQEVLDKKGWTSPRAAQVIALATRPEKQIVSQEVLLTDWQSVGRAYGFSTPEVSHLLETPSPPHALERERDELVHAVRAQLERLSGFTERELVRRIAIDAPGRGLDRNNIVSLAQQILASEEVVPSLEAGEAVFSLRSPGDPALTQEFDNDIELEWEMTE